MFVLIAAPAGRALAQAVRAAGYTPLVADFFDDLDTRDIAESNVLVGGDVTQGFEAESLIAALTSLSDGKEVLGLVYGAGFEDRPSLLDLLSEHWPLLGNAPGIVARVKDPASLVALCADLAIKHPEIRFDAPPEAKGWLVKQAGGSGGVHISRAGDLPLTKSDYYQREVAGTPVSNLLLADGTKALSLGLSEQWVSPAPDQPWRYGGAARPARLNSNLVERLIHVSEGIAVAAHLVGLNSVDFMVDGDDFHLIEINPRPGATLDIFHDAGGGLMRAHIEACQGRLPQEPLCFAAAEAAAFVYAPFAIEQMPVCDWPDWAADRQKPCGAVAENDPLCTVTASGPDLIAARRLLDERAAHILTLISMTHSGREVAA